MVQKVILQPHAILTETEFPPPLPREIRKTTLKWTFYEARDQVSKPELLFQISVFLRDATKIETLSNVLLVSPSVQTVVFCQICFYHLEKQEKKILICNSVSSGFWIKPLCFIFSSGVSRMVTVIFVLLVQQVNKQSVAIEFQLPKLLLIFVKAQTTPLNGGNQCVCFMLWAYHVMI